MFRNYLKVAFKNLIRHKAFSFINIAGLAIGMACSIMILIWVQHERSYDKFNAHADHIYRITADAMDFKVAITPAAMAFELKQKIPAIKNAVRVFNPGSLVFELGDKKFEEKRTFHADSNFLQIFSYPMVKGNRATALDQPNSVLITEAMAEKYFGNENPIGKVLKKNITENVVVTGVLANTPANSHLQFDFLLPMSAIAQSNQDLKNNYWDNFNFYTYLLLDENLKMTKKSEADLGDQITKLYQTHIPRENIPADFSVQALTKIHLYSKHQGDVTGHGNVQYVNIFFIVAIFILAVACINFMNLATARSARRAKEVGLRKAVGAGRKQLIMQFLGESMLISFLSLLIAIGMVYLMMPAFGRLAGKELSFNLVNGGMLSVLSGIAILTGLIAGTYPAIFLSGFQPVKVLKANVANKGGNLLFRNVLVVMQFVISIVLLAGTMIVYRQLNFIKEMNLGFDKSNLLYVPMSGEIWNRQQALKTQLSAQSLTSDFTIVSDLPTNMTSGTLTVEWEGKKPNTQIIFPTLFVNENFFDVFQTEMVRGRVFSKDLPTDSFNYILNEKAVEAMGYTLDNAVGKSMQLWETKGNIIGVVKNFNFKSIQHSIDPLIIGFNKWGGTAVVRTQPGKTETTIRELEKICAGINPGYPFSYGFVDEDLNKLYLGEQQMGGLFNVFAVLAIFISCLGLYGLSAFMAEQRTREIGVRKVLGASVSNVVYLLSTGFTKLIIIATVIAIPLAWFAMNSWLKSFAFRQEIHWITFAIAAISALMIALITVSFESLKAALSNPVKSLRSE